MLAAVPAGSNVSHGVEASVRRGGPAATGKHLTCDLGTCGQERGAARGLGGGGRAGVPGDKQPQCAQYLFWLLVPRRPAGPCELDFRSVRAANLPPRPQCSVLGTGPGPAPGQPGCPRFRGSRPTWLVGCEAGPSDRAMLPVTLQPALPGPGPCDSRRPRPGPSPDTLCPPRSSSRGLARGRPDSSGRGSCPPAAGDAAGDTAGGRGGRPAGSLGGLRKRRQHRGRGSVGVSSGSWGRRPHCRCSGTAPRDSRGGAAPGRW